MTKLTRIRTLACGNGDNCPALDRRDDGGIEVTGYRIDREGLPPGEATVHVPAELLPELPHDVDLGEFIAGHHHADLLRVQTLDQYGVPSDDDDYQRYLDGAPEPTAAGKDAWLQRLRDDTAAGKIRRTVHVVNGPLSDYLRYQFEWCYVPNEAAGQRIRVVDARLNHAAEYLFFVGDFAVVDGRHGVALRYDPTTSVYLGATALGEDTSLAYRALGELAWNTGVPFPFWWRMHLGYHRDHALRVPPDLRLAN